MLTDKIADSWSGRVIESETEGYGLATSLCVNRSRYPLPRHVTFAKRPKRQFISFFCDSWKNFYSHFAVFTGTSVYYKHFHIAISFVYLLR